ncbi:MAG: aminoacetone oxidase family FAD-binding enzyme [Planctomycetota bacterium]|jgi:predicted Rossmann fold flavoprotein|nr:aminoacetone oxidase family FAD-binding enzyme [Planctomycetota bacterium]
MSSTDWLIIGGGAAGLAAARTAAARGKTVTLLEASAAAGEKILAAGGGRCNIGNLALTERGVDYGKFYGAAKNFVKPALSALPSMRDFFHPLGVALIAHGSRLYPADERGATILNALTGADAHLPQITAHFLCPIVALRQDGDGWQAVAGDGRRFFAARALLATGGVNAATREILQSLGHAVTPLLPALAPLTVAGFGDLAGVSVPQVEVWRVAASRRKFGGDLLFTHHGLSGPAILDLSGEVAAAVAARGQSEIAVNFAPALTAAEFAAWRVGGQPLKKRLPLPERLAVKILRSVAPAPPQRAAELTAVQSRNLWTALTAHRFLITQLTPRHQAMVTRGGVALDEVEAKTLASRRHKNLYFAGEILDVDGVSGGFNLQWAIAGGWLVASV